jgi:ribonuclease Y
VKLIEDGRIHPARIEEMYYQSKAEIEDYIQQAGEQAVFEANCGDFHEELVKILGRLRYRTSYGQNVLKHTLEVVTSEGSMAAELGAGVKTTKRAALLHDIGKAMTHEVEGSHAIISAQLGAPLRRDAGRGARDRSASLRSAAADGRGGAPDRRGRDLRVPARARAERASSTTSSGLESLEELAASRPGVEKVYALQAGREIRVIVKPEEVDDDTAVLLSHEIAREIEDQLEYPGQIKVTVIRESRAMDVAANRVDARRDAAAHIDAA